LKHKGRKEGKHDLLLLRETDDLAAEKESGKAERERESWESLFERNARKERRGQKRVGGDNSPVRLMRRRRGRGVQKRREGEGRD